MGDSFLGDGDRRSSTTGAGSGAADVLVRNAYLAALESASIDQDIEPFARFVAEQVARSQEQKG